MKKILLSLLLLPSLAFCDTKISALPSTTTLNSADIIPVVTNPGTTPQNFTITKQNLISTLGITTGGNATLPLPGGATNYWNYPSTATFFDAQGINVSTITVSTQTVTGEIILKDGTIITSTSTFGGGSTSPGGSSTQLQYNNGGSFGGIQGTSVSGNSITLGSVIATTATVSSGLGLGSGLPNGSSSGISGGGGNFLVNATKSFGSPFFGDAYGGFFEAKGSQASGTASYGTVGHCGVTGSFPCYGVYGYADSNSTLSDVALYGSATNGSSNYGLLIANGQAQINSSMTVVGATTLSTATISYAVTGSSSVNEGIGALGFYVPSVSFNRVAATSGNSAAIISQSIVNPLTVSTLQSFGNLNVVDWISNVNSPNASMYGTESQAIDLSTSTVNSVVGAQPQGYNNGGGIVGNLYGSRVQSISQNASSTTVQYGLSVNDFIVTGATVGTHYSVYISSLSVDTNSVVNTNYGLYIDSQTKGNGIFEAQGPNYFGGTSSFPLGITASTITATGLASGQCVQTGLGGLLTVTGSACGSGGTVTSVTGSSPINSTGGTSPVISLSQTIGQSETITGSSFTVAGIQGLSVSGATTAPLVTISTAPNGVPAVQVSSTIAAASSDIVLQVSSQTGTTTFAVQYSGHIVSSGTTPSMGTCGSNPSVIGTDAAAVITVGSGVVTSCTMNFANVWANPPVCVESDNSTAVTGDITTTTTSSITFGFSATLGGGQVNVLCIGNKG